MAEADVKAAGGKPSAFLQCLSQLGHDTFAEVLLPKLIEQGTAADVAMTCTQLRKLCHSSIQKLDLASLAEIENASTAGQWVQALPEHFSCCTSVQLSVDGDTSYQSTHYALPALARLPKLSHLQLNVASDPQPLPMAMLLLSVRTQLTSLVNLQLEVSQSWENAQLIWAELANMTNLKLLRLLFASGLASPVCSSSDLLSLSTLCSLEQLHMVIPAASGPNPVSLDMVSSMTALTELRLSTTNTIERVPGFVSVQGCTNLECLVLSWSRGTQLIVDHQDWQAVAQLTRLTGLVLWPVVVDEAMSAACSPALRQLTCLKELGAEAWTPDVLSVLPAMPQLSWLAGGWLPGELPVGIRCMQNVKLAYTYGNVPAKALPKLTSITLDNALSTKALAAIGRHCKVLKEVVLDWWPKAAGNGRWFSLRDELGGGADVDGVSTQVAAINALTSLNTLTRLAFAPSGSTQLIACIGAAAALCQRNLRRLELVVLPDLGVSREDLVHLGRLPMLGEMYLRLLDDGVLCTSVHALSLLSAVGTVRSLHVVLSTQDQVQVVQEGYDKCVELGLPVPIVFTVETVA